MKTEAEINHCIDLILADDKYYANANHIELKVVSVSNACYNSS